MLNDRITNLYTNIELKAKNRDTLDGQLNELQDQLKNKRVESAMMDQELAKINEEMKIALESSFFEQDDKNKAAESMIKRIFMRTLIRFFLH